MKLKEGLKKEDLAGHTIIVTTGTEESKQVQDVARQLGYRLSNAFGYLEDFLKGNFSTCITFIDGLMYWSESEDHIGSKSLSDLVEEECPEYVKCIHNLMHAVKGKIYPTIIIAGDLFVKAEYGSSDYLVSSGFFEPSTKEEYEAQNTYTGYATEAQADLNRKWEEQHPAKEKYEISIEQIQSLIDLGVKLGVDLHIKAQLEELFPNASIFKEKERTYKIGDRFGQWDEEIGTRQFTLIMQNDNSLALLDNGRSITVGFAIHSSNYDGTTITERELNAIEDSFLTKFKPL